jgi:hypothetical protein
MTTSKQLRGKRGIESETEQLELQRTWNAFMTCTRVLKMPQYWDQNANGSSVSNDVLSQKDQI